MGHLEAYFIDLMDNRTMKPRIEKRDEPTVLSDLEAGVLPPSFYDDIPDLVDGDGWGEREKFGGPAFDEGREDWYEDEKDRFESEEDDYLPAGPTTLILHSSVPKEREMEKEEMEEWEPEMTKERSKTANFSVKDEHVGEHPKSYSSFIGDDGDSIEPDGDSIEPDGDSIEADKKGMGDVNKIDFSALFEGEEGEKKLMDYAFQLNIPIETMKRLSHDELVKEVQKRVEFNPKDYPGSSLEPHIDFILIQMREGVAKKGSYQEAALKRFAQSCAEGRS